VNPVNSTKLYINQALESLGFTDWTPIQSLVMPVLRERKSAVIQSVTGSGKTHSYLVPMFELLEESNPDLQFVISAPTRELARQIFDFAKQIASFSPTPIDMRLYTGGTDRDKEIARLQKSKPQFVVGTPGKLKDLTIQERLLPTHQAKMFIVDEADMTLDEGFLPDVDQVAATFSKTTPIVVASATIPEAITPFLKKYLSNPVFLRIQSDRLTNLDIRHSLLKTKERERIDVLKVLTDGLNPYLAVVFCNTKESAEFVFRQMKEWDKNVTLIHGGLESRKRKQIVKHIHDLKFQYIVATDIISRGIDIEGISHIINYELPEDPEFYIHRSGRTGRMAKDGECISLYAYANDEYLSKLEAKGLHPEYRQLTKGIVVEAPKRNQRASRPGPRVDANRVRKIVGNQPREIKPGYKKKFKEEVIQATKKLARKARDH
jgi:ATP-dependent RNA helicase CshB